MTKKRPKTLTDQLRHHIESADVSRNRIAVDTGIDPASLCRFVAGQTGLSNENIDLLGEYLGLEILKRKGK